MTIPAATIQPDADSDSDTAMVLAACALASTNPGQFIDQLDWSVSSDIGAIDTIAAGSGIVVPFQDRTWLETWMSVIGAPRGIEPHILIGRLGTTVMIIVPLCLETAGMFKNAGFIASEVSDYNHPLFNNALTGHVSQAFMETLWRKVASLLQGVDTLSLRKLPVDPGVDRAVWKPARREQDATHSTLLTGDWAASEDRFFGKTSRKSLSRKEKKLGAAGPLSLQNILDSDERTLAVETLVRWKSLQLGELGLANPFRDGNFTRFLEQAAQAGNPEVYRIYGFFAGKTPLAYTLMICQGEHWLIYQTAYTDAELGKYSPGLFLLREILKSAHDEGCAIFDFGLGNEGYKQKYCDREVTLYRAEIALSVKGWIYKACVDAKLASLAAIKSNAQLRQIALSLLQLCAVLRPDGNQRKK